MTPVTQIEIPQAKSSLLRSLIRHSKRASLCALAVGLAAFIFWPRYGIHRELNESVRVPFTSPEGYMYTTENAFPHLKFFEPTGIVYDRVGDRFFVLERRGTIQVFSNDAETKQKTQVVDFSDRVVRTAYEDDGALGVALHPEFGKPGSLNRGYFYVFYTADVNGDCYDRLSRFTIPDGSEVADPTSELVLIDQRDRDLWHNGGALAFGPDGFLYVGVGDEGELKDYFGNGQRIDRNLFSGMLRIDVDLIGGDVSHAPPRQPDNGTTAHYFIPNDNPFVGMPGALEEFWAIGLRNPHQIAFDPANGQLWTGDVGQDLREEINIVTRGSNHQWSFAEGNLPFKDSYLNGLAPKKLIGVDSPPVHQYAHVNMNNCVIGGKVYRGDELIDLEGQYLFGDNGSGRISALDVDNEGNTRVTELCAINASGKSGLSAFGVDADGEILLLVLGKGDQVAGTIHRLVEPLEGYASAMPAQLSETGVFEDVEALRPAVGAIEYFLNAPAWADGAVTRRWILLPGEGIDPDPTMDRISFAEHGSWKFPPGTIFIKHIEMPLDDADRSPTRRLETQLLVIQNDGAAYGVSYKWNDEGTEANLVEAASETTFDIAAIDGAVRKQSWKHVARDNCMVCHTKTAGYVLGVTTRQLNREVNYPSAGRRNQLSEWSHGLMFTEALDDEKLPHLPKSISIRDKTKPLADRVHSYLDANCAHCHQPGGVRANFDARFEVALENQGIIDGRLLSPTELTGAKLVLPGHPSQSMVVHRMLHRDKRMPLLGSSRRDQQAIQVICEWIDSLPVGESAVGESASANVEQSDKAE
jgi:glucose/arabinose dehydrogenase